MVAKIYLKGIISSFVLLKAESIKIDCPNIYGGIGDLSGVSADSPSLWTGSVWLDQACWKVSFDDVDSVYTRSNLHESDESWILVGCAPKAFTYNGCGKFADKIRRTMG